MRSEITFNTILVPVDFSAPSRVAFEQAAKLVAGDDGVIILLHVIDPVLVQFAAHHLFGTEEEIKQRMRERAESELSTYQMHVDGQAEVDVIISEGVPFMEILQKSEDFVVDAIVIGKVGSRGTLEKLLFGSTAERVLRGSLRPVLVLPLDDSPA